MAQATVWKVDIPIEPGCYTFKFNVDGEWVTRPGDELEDDVEGNVSAVIIVEEEDEDIQKAEISEARNPNEISKIEDLDISTLNIDGKTEDTSKSGTEVKSSENKFKDEVSIVKSTVQDKNEQEKHEDPKIETKCKENSRDENTNPKSERKATIPKVSTPIRKGKAGKLHPDDVESPRRVTRNLLSKLAPREEKMLKNF